MSLGRPMSLRWRSAVPVVTVIANVISYGIFLAAAQLLDPAPYGEALALLNLVVIATVPSFAVQTVVARRTATGAVGPRTLRVTALVALISTALVLLSTPFLVSFMHLSSWLGVLGGALCIPPLVVLGMAQGIAQGTERWRELSMVVLAMGLGRVLGGILGLVAAPSPAGVMIGTAAGLGIAAALVVRPTLRGLQAAPVDATQTVRGLLAECAHAAHAHGVFLLLSSLDLTIARNILSAEDAGWYAAGNVVFRAALWLPQPVATLLLPELSEWTTHRRAARRGLAVVGALVAATVLACLVAGELISFVLVGNKFSSLDDDLWVFAVAGGALALTQYCIYAGLAILRRGRLSLVWSCVAAEIATVYVGGLASTPHQLIAVVATIVTMSAAVAIAVTLVERPDGEPARRPSWHQTAPKTTEPL